MPRHVEWELREHQGRSDRFHRSSTVLVWLSWALLAAIAVLPLWTPVQHAALSWFGQLFDIDTSRIRIEASIARLLLLVWTIVFLAAHGRSRIASLWQLSPWSALPVMAGCAVLASLFVGVLSAAGVNVVFRSAAGATAVFPALYHEDGLMENLTAIAFVVSSFFLVGAALRLRRRNTAAALVLAAAALGGIFIGGEELSWGQRIFGWGSPDYFSANNVQDEINLHNLLSWNVMAHITMLMTAALATASVYAGDIARRLPIRGLALVIPSAGVRLGLLVLPLTLSLVSYNELTEEIVSWIYLCYAFDMLRASGQVRTD